MTYYAQRKSIKDGQPIAPNNRYGDRKEMLRQYFLYCASAATNEAENDYDYIDFGTVEQGTLKREIFDQETILAPETPEGGEEE